MTAEAASGAKRYKVTVDRGSCCGYAACRDICPEVFQIENGLVKVLLEETPPELGEKTLEAAEYCPQACIFVEPIE